MVVWRRTLFCKLGQTAQVAERSKEFARIVMAADDTVKAYRVYTDLSGKTDRVITEIERELLLHPREASRRIHGNPDALRILQEITPLIDGAEVEFLNLELSR